MSTVEHPSYMTVEEVAAKLRVSPLTIRRRIASGDLPAVQLGGPGSSIRIPADALRAWLWSDPEEFRG